jgi:hypothetical protein
VQTPSKESRGGAFVPVLNHPLPPWRLLAPLPWPVKQHGSRHAKAHPRGRSAARREHARIDQRTTSPMAPDWSVMGSHQLKKKNISTCITSRNSQLTTGHTEAKDQGYPSNHDLFQTEKKTGNQISPELSSNVTHRSSNSVTTRICSTKTSSEK